MTLSISPLAKFASGVAEQAQSFAQDAQSAAVDAYSELDRAELDSKLNRLGGQLGSGLNQLTGGKIEADGPAGSGLGPLSTNAIGGAQSIQTDLSNAFGQLPDVNTLTETVGGVANGFGDALDKISGGNLAQGLLDFAGSVSKAAGQIDDILSLKRGANIPNAAELFSSGEVGQATVVDATPVNDWRVRINCDWNALGVRQTDLLSKLKTTNGLIFPYQPQLTFSTRANYDEINPVHTNYPVMAYQNSQVDEIQINGEFSVESDGDAKYVLAATQFLRTATKMFYGQGANVGNPPLVCYLFAYGSNLFNNIPVVVTNFNVTYDNDVNYIKTTWNGNNTWVPILQNMSVNLAPIYNRSSLRQFNLQDYARGTMTTGPGTSGKGYI